MTATLTGDVQVDQNELRAALLSVRPHAGPNKRGSDVLPLHRVRLHIARSFVNVLAASGATMACARVGILADNRPNPEAADDAPFVVDITPDEADGVLKIFPKRRPRKDEPPNEGRVEIRFAKDEVIFEAGPGGLWASGRMLGFNLTDPSTQFPNVLGLLGRAKREVGTTTAAKALVVGGAVLKLWDAAGKAYGAPVRIAGSGDVASPTYVVSVGQMFIGSFGSRPGDDIAVKQYAAWDTEWLRTLPDIDDTEADQLDQLLGGAGPDDDEDGQIDGQAAIDDEGDD